MELTRELQENEQKANGKHAKTSDKNYRPSSPHDAAETARHLALAARATNDALRVWDVAGGALAWPQGLQSLLGYEPNIITSEIGFWQRHLHPEDRTRLAASIRAALAPHGGEHWSGEYRFRKADGSYLLLLERALIERDEAGEAVRWVGSMMDITARKQLQDQVVRSQKMEAFGQLAGGVAHDFNNFLTTILGYSDLLQHELKGANAKHVGEIRAAASRASALTAQLLAFSRKHPLQRQVVEVNTVINNMERSLLRLLGDNISVECHLHHAKEPAHINADPGQLTQILLNLAVNARDAMPKGGRLTLGTGTVRIDQAKQPKGCDSELAPGEYVIISMTDNGVGMSEETKAHLFEPFFTAKDGNGTGLGLATSYGIIRQSGGQICVASELGKGTMVTIYLPKVAAPPAPIYKKLNGKKAPAGTETVLVLEDDVSVRHLSVRVLRSLGYDVVEAATGDDAQRLIALDPKKQIHLLLTDIMMPHMSGHDFAEWFRITNPTAKVIFISGYLDCSLGDQCGGNGMFFLPKPFDADQLATKVRAALDSV